MTLHLSVHQLGWPLPFQFRYATVHDSGRTRFRDYLLQFATLHSLEMECIRCPLTSGSRDLVDRPWASTIQRDYMHGSLDAPGSTERVRRSRSRGGEMDVLFHPDY